MFLCGQPVRKSRPFAGWSGRKRILAAAIGLLVFGGLGLAFGIFIHLKKDNKTTTVEVPEGSTAHVDARGDVTVELPPAPRPAGAVPSGTVPSPYEPTYPPGAAAGYAPPFAAPPALYPSPVPQDPLHDQWDVARIEKGKDADGAWAKIFGSPMPPPATLYRLYISDMANEENTLLPMWRPPLGQPPNKSLPAPLVYGPFRVRRFCFDKEPEPFAPVKTIDLYSFNPFLRRPTGPLVALGIYELDGDHLKICLRAASHQHNSRSAELPGPAGARRRPVRAATPPRVGRREGLGGESMDGRGRDERRQADATGRTPFPES